MGSLWYSLSNLLLSFSSSVRSFYNIDSASFGVAELSIFIRYGFLLSVTVVRCREEALLRSLRECDITAFFEEGSPAGVGLA